MRMYDTPNVGFHYSKFFSVFTRTGSLWNDIRTTSDHMLVFFFCLVAYLSSYHKKAIKAITNLHIYPPMGENTELQIFFVTLCFQLQYVRAYKKFIQIVFVMFLS